MKRVILIFVLMTVSIAGFANDAELNQTLVRIINQLNAVLPLLDEAKTEIAKTDRMQLHIESFEGADGQQHPGLRDDLLSIRNALIDYINKPVLEPKTIKPLALDFVGQP